MAANFGPAVFDAQSTKGKAELRTASELNPGRIYRWEVNKRKPNGDTFFTCNTCRKEKTRRNSPHANSPLPRLKVSDGILRSDPDHPTNPHFCTGQESHVFTATELNRTMRSEMVQGVKRPSRAYQDICAKVPRLGETAQFRQNVEDSLPSLQSMKSSLNRWRRREHAQYDRVEDIPENHKCTLATVEEPQENKESYVIYQRPGQRQTLMLASRSDIRTLAILRHIIGDGTFKYCPRGFAQLYAIHGMIENDLCFEWKVLIIALLPDKTQETYTLLFQQIRHKLIEMFPADDDEFWANEIPVQAIELINERLTRYLDHMAHCLGVDKKFGVTEAERQAQEAHQAIEANNWFIIQNNVNAQAANDIENVPVANGNVNVDHPYVLVEL